MITGLPPAFISAMNNPENQPVLLLIVQIESTDYYLAGREIQYPVTEETITFQPWIESWGELGGNSKPEGIVNPGNIESREQGISLIYSPETKNFIRLLFEVGVHNVRAILYRTFLGLDYYDKYEIGDLLIQDPISIEQGAMKLRVDLVSRIMKNNPPLTQPEPNKKRFPWVVGKAKDVVLELLPDISSPFTTLSEAVTTNQTGKFYLESTKNLLASGALVLDEEVLAYDSLTEASINVTGRGGFGTQAAPHSGGAGAYQSQYPLANVQRWYYGVTAGPVHLIDNIKANKEPYQHVDWVKNGVNHIAYDLTSNPARVIAAERPLWIGTESTGGTTPITPDPEIKNYQATLTEVSLNTSGLPGSIITNAPGVNLPENFFCLSRIQSDLGGGQTTRFKSSDSISSINHFSNDNAHINGSKSVNLGQFRVAYVSDITPVPPLPPTATFPPDGETASISWINNTDLNSLGTLDSQRITYHLTAVASNANMTVKVYFVENDTTEHLLRTLSNNQYGNYHSSFASWSGNTYTDNLDSWVADFDDLVGASLKVEVEMASINQIVGSDGFIEVSLIQWQSDYTDLPAGGLPYQEVVARSVSVSAGQVAGDLSAAITFRYESSDAETEIQVVTRATSDPNDNDILDTFTLSENTEEQTKTYSLPALTPFELSSLRFGLRQTLIGITDVGPDRVSSIYISKIVFTISTQGPDYFDVPETRVIFPETITCDVESLGLADEVPSAAAYRLMTLPTHSGAINVASFNAAGADYLAAGFFLNGLLPADSTYHSALKEILRHGIARLDHSSGNYLPHWQEDTSPPVMEFTDWVNHPRIAGGETVNAISGLTAEYNRDYLESVFRDNYNAGSPNAPELAELPLVESQAIAELWADRIYALKSGSQRTYHIDLPMNAFPLQKGDMISIPDFLFDGYVKGNVLSITDSFELGKTSKPDFFRVELFAPVTYTPPPEGGPPNDNFVNAELIFGSSGGVAGTNVDASKESGEPDHAGLPGGASIWYRWVATSSNPYSFDTYGSILDDTILAVYTGTIVSDLTEIASNDEDDENGGPKSQLFFAAIIGTTYHIAIDGFAAEEGVTQLNWSEIIPPINDNFSSAILVTGSSGSEIGTNTGATKEPGEPDHAGGEGGASIWFDWVAPSSSTYFFDTDSSAFDTLLGVYTGASVGALSLVAENDDDPGISPQSKVTFAATSGITYRVVIDGWNGSQGITQLNWGLV